VSADVDFVARLADAWDGRGRQVLRPPGEHLALLMLAFLPAHLHLFPWRELDEATRQRLVRAARQAVDLGRQCAWVFGEGEGA
jgi:hypothetical protein